MNTLILFGAGASFGSEPFGMPPLGTELFDSLRQFNPDGWGRIGEPYASAFRADFENGMVSLSNSNQFALPVLQRAMAAFFFRYLPTTKNLYFELAKRIRTKSWLGALATLNYERLLEISLMNVGIQPIVNMGSASAGRIEYCLPHGCCHLFCESVQGMASAVSFSGMNVTTNGPVVAVSNPDQFWSRINNDAFPPVMSYFEPQKRTTSGANLISEQRRRWDQLCASATTIAIIGVHPRSHDSHIWAPLHSSKAQIVYCGGAAGAAAFEEWRTSSGRSVSDKIFSGYFADEFENICEAVGL